MLYLLWMNLHCPSTSPAKLNSKKKKCEIVGVTIVAILVVRGTSVPVLISFLSCSTLFNLLYGKLCSYYYYYCII